MSVVPLNVAVARRIAELKAEEAAALEQERQAQKARERREQAAAAALVDWLKANEGIMTEFEDWTAEEVYPPDSDAPGHLGTYRFTFQPWDPFWRPLDEDAPARGVRSTYVWRFDPGEGEAGVRELIPTYMGNSDAPKWSVWQRGGRAATGSIQPWN